MISRLNLLLAFVLALSGLAILAFATSAFKRAARDSPAANLPARDGLSDAMTFSPPAGPKP
ncbi:hypothetical protein [uncultured Enterovirga sp.]|uniref:hypothetical protein n=1 Tax=uncultured Enterovirga sp. TaxID=2026352 RepID=UPI0035CB1856